MAKTFQDLGVFSDLVAAAKKSHKLFPRAKPGKATQKAVLESLAFNPGPPVARGVRVERTWSHDGVVGEAITYSVGFGPRTEAWLLRPEGVKEKLPGVIALHDHGGFKYLGKEKVAIGPEGSTKLQNDWFERVYGNRAFANHLAKLGFAVLVPDVFTWGSRRIPYRTISAWDRDIGNARHDPQPALDDPILQRLELRRFHSGRAA